MKRLVAGMIVGLVMWLSPAALAVSLATPSSFCFENHAFSSLFIPNRDGYTQNMIGDFSLSANYLTQRVTCEWVAYPDYAEKFDAPSGSFELSPGPVPYVGAALTFSCALAALVRWRRHTRAASQ